MATSATRFTFGMFVLNFLLTLIVFPVVILLLAGDARWVEGWILGLWISAMIISNMVYLYRSDPDLLAERTSAHRGDNQKPWDRYLLTGLLLLVIAWLVLMPLDARRFHWSPAFPLWVKVMGGLMLVPALYLIYRATVENTFLSTAVRIQEERGQRVISTGVYGLVRHPLYLGCALMMFGAPLLLGSVVGLVISALGMAAVVVRLLGEEKMLLTELNGYADYQQKVRYRLIPFIW